jgi:hypothetical protein
MEIKTQLEPTMEEVEEEIAPKKEDKKTKIVREAIETCNIKTSHGFEVSLGSCVYDSQQLLGLCLGAVASLNEMLNENKTKRN